MRKIINIASFSRSRLNQDAVKGSYYGWHSQFARHLVGKVNANVESWSIDAALPEERRYEKDGVVYRLFPSGFFLSPGRELSTTLLKALKREVHEHDVVVHLHDYHNWQSYAIALTARVPVVAHYHGATRHPIENLTNARRWLVAPLFLIEQAFENLAVRKIQHFFLANTRDHRWYDRRSLPYSFCPMAVEEDIFVQMDRSAARRSLGIPDDATVLLNVGGFAPLKRIELFLGAFSDIRRDTNAAAYLLGPTYVPAYAASIRSMVERLELQSSVTILGMVPRERLNEYYCAADALVITSDVREGGPVVALEALAVGLPVVATPVGFLPDLAPKARGLLTIVDDPSKLAAAIRSVAIGSSRKRSPMQAWTWRDVLHRVSTVYDKLQNN